MALTQIRKEQIKDLTIDNSKIAENAAIAYSKLNLASSIVASDLNTSTNRVHDAVLDSKLIALWDMVTEQEVSGTSTDVSAVVTSTAQTDTATDGSSQVKGVLLTGTGLNGTGVSNYRIQIRNSDTKEPVCDNLNGAGNGSAVYGELRNDGTKYTLHYFKSNGDVYSFADAVQVTDITTSTSTTSGSYFTYDTPTNKYFVWYSTGSESAPTVAGRTGVQVAIKATDSVGIIAKKTAIVLDALSDINASYVDGTAEKTSILCKANTSGSLNGKYFVVNSTTTKYVVYFTTNGVGSVPTIDGTKVQVDLSGDLLDTAVATATNTAISSYFTTSVSGNTITLTNTDIGTCVNASAGTSEFFITQLEEGKDPLATFKVTNTQSGYCDLPTNGTTSPNFTFNLVSGGVSKIDFMFVEIYSYYTAPLMSFVTGMGFSDVVGVSGTHNHNDLYYSRTELNSGALDNRYYTETELNGGQLDSRYFTKNDLSISGPVSSNVLDARYFTESELAATASGSAGASLIGITPTGNLASSNVQTALVEIQGDVDKIISGDIDIKNSLDDAYNDGSTVTVDNTNVDFVLSTGKKFIVSDATDTNKVVVTSGSALDSIKIDTTGGIDINADNGINISSADYSAIELNNDGSNNFTSYGDFEIKAQGNGDLHLVSIGSQLELYTTNTTTNNSIYIHSDSGGIDIDAKKDIDIASEATLKLKDINLTTAIPLSQSGTAALSSHFDTATSIVGAINENANDLYTLINSTLPSTTDNASGADKIGATGISGVIPTGKSLGADGTVQEMLEGIAMGAGGGKTFENIAAFTTSKAGGTYFKVNEPVFILDTNRWVIVETQSVNIIENTDWYYVGGSNANIGGQLYKFDVSSFDAHGSSEVDISGGIGQLLMNATGTILTTAGDGNTTTVSGNDVKITGTGTANKVEITSTEIDLTGTTNVNGKTTIIGGSGNDVSIQTTGTGKITESSDDTISLTGGDVTITSGMGKSTVVSSDTLVGITSATKVAVTGGEIDLNSGIGKKIIATSDTEVDVNGGNLINLTATEIDINGKLKVAGESADITTTKSTTISATELLTLKSTGTAAGNGVSISSAGIAGVEVNTTGTGNISLTSNHNANITANNINTTGILTQTGSTVINGSVTATAPVGEDIILKTSGTEGGVYLESEKEIELKSAITRTTGNVTMPDDSWLSVGNIKITSVDPSDYATISGSRSGTVNTLDLITNPGFEAGSGITATGWTQNAISTRISTNRYYGSFSLHTYSENTAANIDFASSALTGIKASTTYNVSFYIKGTTGGDILVSIPGATNQKLVDGPINYATWTRVTLDVTTDAVAGDGNIIFTVQGTGTEYYSFDIDAVMVSEGAGAKEYFVDKKSELVFSIGDEDDDRIIMRSEGTTTRDLIRVNQNNVEILGNLQVSGTTTTVNSEELLVADNQIILNSNVTGAPSLDASFTVNRGSSPDVAIKWNESSDKWELTNDGTTYSSIVTTGGSGSLSLDTAYDGGSQVTVDNTDVDFVLGTGKKFIVSDATDTNKVVVTSGSDIDSVKIDTTGGIDIDVDNGFTLNDNSGAYININTNGEIQSRSATGQQYIIANHDGDNAIIISDGALVIATNPEHYVNINALGGLNIDTEVTKPTTIDTGSFSIDGVLASNVSVTGADLTLSTITSGKVIISSADEVDINATTAKITATNIINTGILTQNGNAKIVGVLDLDGDFDQTGNYKFKVDSTSTEADSVKINTTGGIDIDATGTIDVKADTINTSGKFNQTGKSVFTGDIQVVGSLDVDGETVSITSTGTAGSHLAITSADKVVINGIGIDIDAGTGSFKIDGDSNSSINTTASDIKISTTTSGNVVLDSAGSITFKDSVATVAIPFSQANAGTLSGKFAYNSQTAFDWTTRSTGTDSITSVMGALDANRQDLYEFVELLNTQGAPIGVAAGANLIGCDGIKSITPNRPGASLGDNGTVQEMLEALAVTGGGSCKHFANLQDFLDYKSGTGAYTEAGYFNLETQCYLIDVEREIRVLTQSAGIVQGTDWEYLWGDARPLSGNKFKVTASAFEVDTVGNIVLNSDTGFSIVDEGNTFAIGSTGITTTLATGKKYTVTTTDEIELNAGTVDINGTNVTIDGSIAITGTSNTDVTMTSSGTGKTEIISASEVLLAGGKVSLAAGVNSDVVISTTTGSGKVDINATNAFEIDAGSASHISVAGNLTLQTTVGELYLDDSRTSAIPLSDASNTTFASGTSIIGAINAAYNKISSSTQVEYEEHTVDSTDVTNDYILTNISLLPTTGTFPLTPSALRNLTDKVCVAIYLNGLRLTNSEFNYTYQASERRFTFDGTNNITLVAGDVIAIEVTKITASN